METQTANSTAHTGSDLTDQDNDGATRQHIGKNLTLILCSGQLREDQLGFSLAKYRAGEALDKSDRSRLNEHRNSAIHCSAGSRRS
jgi:hypothetical protein